MAREVLGQLRLDLGRPPVSRGPASSCGSSTSRCSKASTTTAARCPRTTRSRCRTPTTSTGSSPIRCRCAPRSYDLVLNGWELGSGSVRIHRPDMQQRIFSLLGIDAEDAQERFGFLLDAFRFGAPPHAGFAVGIDRLAAILAGEENIREVIAFPKTQSGVDPLTNAPSPIDASQLKDLGLKLPPETHPTPIATTVGAASAPSTSTSNQLAIGRTRALDTCAIRWCLRRPYAAAHGTNARLDRRSRARSSGRW